MSSYPSTPCGQHRRTHVHCDDSLKYGNIHITLGINFSLNIIIGSQAHQHATNADEFIAKGLLIPAAEAHQKSADAFQSCIEASNDENVCVLSLLRMRSHTTKATRIDEENTKNALQ